MKIFPTFTLSVLFLIGIVAAAGSGEVVDFSSDNIKVLDSRNFKQDTSEGLWIIEFYSPTCKHCKKLAPIYIELSNKFSNLIAFGQVNCKENVELCDKLLVDGYPTLFLFYDGWKIEEYEESRTFADMSKYISDANIRYAPFSQPVIDLHDLKTINNGIFFVKFYSPNCIHCTRLAPKYSSVAYSLKFLRQSHQFYMAEVNCMVEANICDQQDLTGYPTLKLFQDGKEVGVYQGAHDEEAIRDYLIENIAQLTKKQVQLIKNYPVPPSVQPPSIPPTSNPPSAPGFEELPQKPDANNVPNEPLPPIIPPKQPEAVQKDAIPSQPQPPLKVAPVVGAPVIEAAKKWLKSPGNVISLTDSTFENELKNGLWLVEFFAPWCGHCKQLKPIWESLAKELFQSANVADVDCPANPSVASSQNIRGYPTIKLFYDGVEISEYRGPRTLEKLKEFAGQSIVESFKYVTSADFAQVQKLPVSFIFLSLKNSPDSKLQLVAKKNVLDASFFYTHDQSMIEQHINDFNSDHLIVFKDGQFGPILNTDYSEVEVLMKWVQSNKYPALIALNQHNSEDLFKKKEWMLMALFDPSNPSFKKQIELLEDIAKNTRGSPDSEVFFVWLDAIQWEKYATSSYGITPADLPALLIIHPDGDEYYTLNSNGEKINFDKFDIMDSLHGAKEGTLRPQNVRGTIGALLKAFSKGFGGIFEYIMNHFVQTFIFLLGVFVIAHYVFGVGKSTETEYRGPKAD